MPVFSLFDQAPDMAPPDRCYVAETAIVIGKVRIKAGAKSLVRRGAARRQ